MSENFMAVGADELGESLGEQARCPHCHKNHVVEYGNRIVRDPDGTEHKIPSTMLAFVKCPTNQSSYLVGIAGKELNHD